MHYFNLDYNNEVVQYNLRKGSQTRNPPATCGPRECLMRPEKSKIFEEIFSHFAYFSIFPNKLIIIT